MDKLSPATIRQQNHDKTKRTNYNCWDLSVCERVEQIRHALIIIAQVYLLYLLI